MFRCCTKWSSVFNSIYSGQELFSYTRMLGLPGLPFPGSVLPPGTWLQRVPAWWSTGWSSWRWRWWKWRTSRLGQPPLQLRLWPRLRNGQNYMHFILVNSLNHNCDKIACPLSSCSKVWALSVHLIFSYHWFFLLMLHFGQLSGGLYFNSLVT